MATTKEDIKQWLERGKSQKATHVIIACDTFDHGDYPVYVMPSEDVHERAKAYNRVNMQRIMEVYNLSMDIESQLNEGRAVNY